MDRKGSMVSRQILAGLVGGFVAGALVGVVEILLLALFTGEWWGCLETVGYAVAVYGIVCTMLGTLCGLGWGLWSAWRRRSPSGWPAYALVVAIGPLILVATTRVEQDLFGGGAALDRANYLWVLVLLIVALDVAFVGLAVALRRASSGRRAQALARSRRGLVVGLGLLLVAVGISYGLVPLLTAGQSAASPLPHMPPDLRDRPNVIVILVDTLRADRLGCYGSASGLTPAIDALARDGVVYQDMTVQSSWTKPSVATLLTSMYPTSHRAIYEGSLLPDAVTTLPEVLSAAGYRTVAFSTNPHVSPGFNFQQGFDEFYLVSGRLFGAPTAMATGLTFYVYAIRAWNLAVQQGLSVPLWPGYVYQEASGLNGEYVTRWLEANQRSRFFMYVHYMDPHDPYFEHPYDGYALVSSPHSPRQPGPELVPEMNRLYDGEVAYLDAYVGRLLQALKTWGLYDDALIIFTSDHGEEFGEHGGFHHGETLYQEQVAVPLIAKYPGATSRGLADNDLARCLDIAPTVLDVVGLARPPAMQGRSLHPGADESQTIYAFAEVDRWGNVVQCIRDERYKLIVANADNPRGLPPMALFDLQADPGEQHNLFEEAPEAARRLRAQLDQVMAFAEAHAVADQAGELDPATRERLRQLGY